MPTFRKCTYPGSVGTKIQECWKLIENIGLGNSINTMPSICDDIASMCRKLNYVEEYRFLLENNCYNILLKDFSFFWFFHSKANGADKYSFSFYESPSNIPSFDEYIQEIGFPR